MNLEEFVEEGYLQEVNRRFFHPLGLALEVKCSQTVQDGTDAVLINKWELSGVWDYRDDPEGMTYAPDNSEEKTRKHNNINKIIEERKPIRENALGYWIQPIEEEPHEEH